jgi:hypothetical protein
VEVDPHFRPGGILQLQSALATANPRGRGQFEERSGGILCRLTLDGSSLAFDPFLEHIVVDPQRLGSMGNPTPAGDLHRCGPQWLGDAGENLTRPPPMLESALNTL